MKAFLIFSVVNALFVVLYMLALTLHIYRCVLNWLKSMTFPNGV
jgi:hypothetical protein